MGIKSIKSAQNNEQITLNAVFSFQDMVKYKQNRKVSQNYDFLEEIGSGAQGQVYRAKCRTTGNLRAIKKVNKFRNQKTIENIENEFNILKHIDHPCIVKMFEMYEEDIHVFIVTELCEGKELFQLILQDKVIGEELAFPLFYQILTTLNFLHKNHIMHRDIKPENIIVNPHTNSVKLIDLGSATKFEDSLLRKRKRIGTVFIFVIQSYYIAPEVLKREYNEKCDIWSAGVILYILLSGALPFKGQEDLDVLKAVENSQVEFPPNKWKNVSIYAKQLVKKMLERDVSKRPFAHELLDQTWIKSSMQKLGKESMKELNQKVINSHLMNMKKFKQLNLNPIQDGVFIFIVNFVQNKKDEKEFMQTFRALDTNRDGVISVQELVTGLEKYLKLKRTECQIIAKKIFEKVDVNGSGYIDYSEFVMSASNIQIVVTEENIDLAFNYMDADGSGKLTVQEIREKLGDSVTQEQYNSLLREFDKNSDGQISRYEFRDMMKALVRKPTANGVKPVLNSTKPPLVPSTNNKSLSSTKPPLNSIKQPSNISPIKSAGSKDVGVLKRTSVSKVTKK